MIKNKYYYVDRFVQIEVNNAFSCYSLLNSKIEKISDQYKKRLIFKVCYLIKSVFYFLIWYNNC